MKTVYYFGNELSESKFSASLKEILYTSTGQRYAWEFLKKDIANGEKVIVKEATPSMIELIRMFRKLK